MVCFIWVLWFALLLMLVFKFFFFFLRVFFFSVGMLFGFVSVFCCFFFLSFVSLFLFPTCFKIYFHSTTFCSQKKVRVLSLLVRLPNPNQSSVAPPIPCLTAFIFFGGPNHGSFASSIQQLFTPLLSRWQYITLLSSHLYIYAFEPFVSFPKLRYITALNVCLTNVLQILEKNAKGKQKLDIQLSACSTSVTFIRIVSETHKYTFK